MLLLYQIHWKIYVLEHQKIALENVIIKSEAGHMHGTIKAILSLLLSFHL